MEAQEVECQTLKPEAKNCQELERQTIELETVEPLTTETESFEDNSLHQESQSNGHSDTVLIFSEQETLVIWRQPTLTLLYFLKELFVHIRDLFLGVAHCRRTFHIILTLLIFIVYLNSNPDSYHPTLFWAQRKFLWCIYWVSLGLLSSVGLGTGIHTFALYLGPYIASVTVAANECGYVNYVEDSNTGVIECPHDPDPRWAATLWNIMCKVRLESYMWGLGTAVGELPPYFMGRAARLSGQEESKDVLREFEELQRKNDERPESLTRLDKLKLLVRDLVVKAGFWGILVCASIPNPFFDLAGITCGNFLVPFSTFFGATLIGKAVIKTTLQQVFIILSFNKAFLVGVVDMLSKIPLLGQRLQTNFSQYIDKQKEKLNEDSTDESPNSGWVLKAYHIFVICTFLYFFISIINSLAQNHHMRLKKYKLKRDE